MDRQADRWTNRQADTCQTDRYAGRQIDDRQVGSQEDRHTDRQKKGRQSGRQADRPPLILGYFELFSIHLTFFTLTVVLTFSPFCDGYKSFGRKPIVRLTMGRQSLVR